MVGSGMGAGGWGDVRWGVEGWVAGVVEVTGRATARGEGAGAVGEMM